MLDLRISTPPAWLEVVFADFDSFLIDHACCERKASATGMSFVVRYPDKPDLLEPMIEFAREELEHFHRVFKALSSRGLALRDDYQDEYVNRLRKSFRGSGGDPLVDGLLVAGVIEALSDDGTGVLIGHDWGAPIVWNTALTRPDRVSAVAGLSVPYTGVPAMNFLDLVKVAFTDKGHANFLVAPEGTS